MKKHFSIYFLLLLSHSIFAQDLMITDKSSILPEPLPAPRLEVTYIANSGFLFTSGSNRVLIDAIYLDGEVWEAPSKKILKSMVAGNPPFKNITHLLVSHYHEDHFDATLTAKFLVNNPKTYLITNKQTDSVMRRVLKMDPQFKRPEQSKIIETPMFGMETYESGSLRIKCMAQRHMGKEDYNVMSMGFLIDFSGKKVLHIGDADFTEENFKDFGLEDENIDLAFIHYRFLLDCEGRRIIDEYIKPKKIVVTHIPYDELRRDYKRMREYYPDIEVFLNHMDKKVY